MKKYHMIVIGGGTAGLVTAGAAAILGAKVALLEMDKMGGDCLNTGCVPSKAIIKTAKAIYDRQTGDRFGLPVDNPHIDWEKVFSSQKGVIKKIEPHDSPERFENFGVDIYFGKFKFESDHQLTDGKILLYGKRIVIATGAAPSIPKIPGLDQVDYLTSETIWHLPEKPKSMVILGGGPIGCELAQTFHRLGVKVSLVDLNSKLLSREDSEASSLIKKQFEEEGIELYLGAKSLKLVSTDNGQDLFFEIENSSIKISMEKTLVATGRSPRVNSLDLDKVGVKYDHRGVHVNSYLRTNKKHIYACGDVISPYQFTHTADYEARLIVRNALFPGRSKINYNVVPWATFTDPEVARVGYNEKEAKEKGLKYDIYQVKMDDLDRAICDRETKGFIKVITPKKSDQILGVTIVGYHAGDLIHELVLAMHQKIGLKSLANMIHIYPTLAEISKQVIDDYQLNRLTDSIKSWIKRYLRLRFG